MIIKDRKLTHDEATALQAPMALDLESFFNVLFEDIMNKVSEFSSRQPEEVIAEINRLFSE